MHDELVAMVDEERTEGGLVSSLSPLRQRDFDGFFFRCGQLSVSAQRARRSPYGDPLERAVSFSGVAVAVS